MNDSEKIREELLVLRCQLGEEAAFRDLVNLMEGKLFYYIRRLLRDEATAYDVLQEVWITVFRKVRNLRDAKMFRVWVYRIAHDKAISLIRREIARERAEENYGEEALNALEDIQFTVENANQIHTLLEKLSTMHREVLTLFFIEELTYDEIAVITRCTVGTVKSRLYYAKRSLRKFMEENADGRA
jgi:RNA polymerase sigma-70 factor, ECF subfamily